MRAFVLLIAAAGCRIPPGEIPDDPLDDLPPPSLSSVEWACDADGAQWELLAETTSWSGGGALWLTADARYVEQHPVRSIAAAADGSTDTLRVRLSVEPDWRLVQAGESTAFTCGEPADGLFVVYDPSGEVADCAWLGPDQAWQGVDGLPACESPFDGS